MRQFFAALVFFLAISVGIARADSLASATPVVVLPDPVTVATLPDPTKNQARYVFVTDLGGGPDMVLSDGANWKHIRQGVVTVVQAASSVTLTPLRSPPVIQFASPSLLASMTVSVSGTNLYPGETFHIIIPSGVLAAAGAFGISADGGLTSLPLVGGTWADFMWNGAALVKTAGGTL